MRSPDRLRRRTLVRTRRCSSRTRSARRRDAPSRGAVEHGAPPGVDDVRRGLTAWLLCLSALAPAAGPSISLHQDGARAARTARRTGLVHLANRAYADNGGPFLAVGASLFWADWGYLNDRPRTRAIICRLGQDGIDF